ncbi:MAG: type II CAAX endopeptidase family protein [Cyanobacteria bacterium P01_H01_bin.121]
MSPLSTVQGSTLPSLNSVFQALKPYPAPIRIIGFLLCLAVVWAPLAIPLSVLITDPNWRSIITLSLLYTLFMVLVRYWGKIIWGYDKTLQHYGLVWQHSSFAQLWLNVLIGVGALGLFYGLITGLGWATWHIQSRLSLIALEGLAIALAVGFAEELLFRGWLLDELTHDYSDRIALLWTAALFAGVHSPPYQFPGLLLLGLALVWAKRACSQHLSSAIGLHAGFVWGYYLTQVGQIVQVDAAAPEWLVGIDRNPLASAPGVLALIVLVLGYRSMAFRRSARDTYVDVDRGSGESGTTRRLERGK